MFTLGVMGILMVSDAVSGTFGLCGKLDLNDDHLPV